MKNIILFLFIFFIGSSVFSQSWDDLNKQGIDLYNKGDYQSASTIHEKALRLALKEKGKNSKEYTTSLNNLGMMYRMLGKYDEAEKCFVEDLPLREKLNGKYSVEYLITVNNLAVVNKLTGRYDEAEKYYLEALEIAAKVHGENDPYYSIYLNNLASLYKATGKYNEAETYYLQAKDLLAKNLPSTRKDYSTCIGNLAILYRTMGDFAKAGPLYMECLELKRQSVGENTPEYATVLNNTALYYEAIDDYKKAENCYIQAQNILETSLGKDNPEYATFITNLGTFYMDMGDLEKAESYIMEGAEIRKAVLGEMHPDYALSLGSMGSLYHTLGDFKKSETYYLQSLTIRKQYYGEVSISCGVIYNGLALLYYDTDDFDRAEENYLKSVEINKILFGEDHVDYATVINNLAVFYKTLGKFKQSEDLLLKAAKIRKKAYGENSIDYAATLTNLASVYIETNHFSQAESLLLESIKVYATTFGSEHPATKVCFNHLVNLYMAMGDFNKAYTYMQPSLGIYKKSIKDASAFLSASELQNFAAEQTDELNVYQSLEWIAGKTNPEFTKILAEFRLYRDGLQMRTSYSLKKNILLSNDTALFNAYTKWVSYKSQISNQLSLPITDRNDDLNDWMTIANDLEKNLLKNSSDFRNANLLNVRIRDVTSSLHTDEAAIEFVSFNFYTGKRWTDSIYYAAVIFLPEDTIPKYVPLFEERQLSGLLSGDTLRTFANLLYTDAQVRNVTNEISYGDSLYKLIWKPMETYLKNAKNIYYSPAGLLHNISLDAIPNRGMLLSDQFTFSRSTTIAELINSKKAEFTPSSVVLFGGIQYDTDVSDLKKRADANELASRSIPDDASRGGSWTYLNGTKKEVESISSILNKNSVKNTIYSEQSGTEEVVKGMEGASSPSILHFSTHGYFFPDPEKDLNHVITENVFSNNSDPLLRSGLILSGANYVWQGNSPIKGVEDGILTALEVSDLYLPNTELVVMSACETGKGDIKTSEGVYGLQRAFKIAGVEYMIVSLWQVLDKETSDFMILFYENLLIKKSIPLAFKATQDAMKNKYRDEPYKWAGFVLIK